MTKKDKKIVVFPGMLKRLLYEAQTLASEEQYEEAVEKFDQAFPVYDFDEANEVELLTYGYCLYHTKAYEKAKEVCDYLLNDRELTRYFEVMEILVSVGVDQGDYQQVEKIVNTLLEDGVVPEELIPQYKQLQRLNERIKKGEVSDYLEAEEEEFLYELEGFFEHDTQKQLSMLQKVSTSNIRPYVNVLKRIIEHKALNPFVKSAALILLVEQQVQIDITVEKFGHTLKVNPAELELPISMPNFIKVKEIIQNTVDRDPSILNLIEEIIAKHAIVTYPFEWLDYEPADVATGYIDYIEMLFGKQEIVENKMVEFIRKLEKLSIMR